MFLCVCIALSYLDVFIKDYYFEVSPRLRVPRLFLLCDRDRRPDLTVSVVPSPRFVLFVFFKFVILFLCFVPRGKRVRWPRALMPAVRGSLRRRSRLSHPAIRGSSREFTPPFAAQPSRRSRLSDPAVRGTSRRRSRLTLAHRPAAESMPAGLPLTQCPPACL